MTTGEFGREPWYARALALALVAIIAAVLGFRSLRPPLTVPEARLEINTPATGNASLALSPDGLKIVFVAVSSGGQPQLWLRTFDSWDARPLPGTERATSPFWSPDNRSLGFFADASLKRMEIDGGSARTLSADAPVGLGGAWNREGTILFSRDPGGPILRISADGGEPIASTRLEPAQHRGHAWPQFLPDGRHFLFYVTGSTESRGVYVGQLDDPALRRLFDADAPAVYATAKHLLFVRDGQLFAQGFDPDRLGLDGDPYPITDHVSAGTMLSASAAGPIAYRTGGTPILVILNWKPGRR